jgi:hypothetical protein
MPRMADEKRAKSAKKETAPKQAGGREGARKDWGKQHVRGLRAQGKRIDVFVGSNLVANDADAVSIDDNTIVVEFDGSSVAFPIQTEVQVRTVVNKDAAVEQMIAEVEEKGESEPVNLSAVSDQA